MRTTNEFVIEWITGDDRATVTVPEGTALSTRLIKLSEEYPTEVEMLNSELFHIPSKWVKVNPPRQLSEETRQQMAERLRNSRSTSTI